jgi:membrane-associated phospholipid phosphatase
MKGETGPDSMVKKTTIYSTQHKGSIMKTFQRTLIAVSVIGGCFAMPAFSGAPAATDSTLHPYKYVRWASGGIIGVGLVSDYIMIPKILHKKDLTDAELAGLNRDVYISKFDRWALELDPSRRSAFKKYSDYLSVAIYGSAGCLLFDRSIRHEWLDIVLLALETHSVAFSAYNLSFFGPAFQNRYRPVAYYNELSTSHRKAGNNRNSFYSGHVASSTTGTFFMAKVYSDFHPELGLKKYLLYGAAAVPPLFLGYLRVRSLDHFPSDAGVGFIIGAVCGVLVPEMHRQKDKHISVGAYSLPDGGSGLSIKWEPSSGK